MSAAFACIRLSTALPRQLLLLLLLLATSTLCKADSADQPPFASVSDFLESVAVSADASAASTWNCSATVADAAPLRVSASSAGDLRRRLLLRRLPPLLVERAAAVAEFADNDTGRRSCQLATSSQQRCRLRRRTLSCRHVLHVACVRAASVSGLTFVGVRVQAEAQLPAAACSDASVQAALRSCAARHLLGNRRLLASVSSSSSSASSDAVGDSSSPRGRRRRSTPMVADTALVAGIERVASLTPRLRRRVNSARTSAGVRRIVRRGFETFSASAAVQAVESVSRESYAAFADYVLELVEADPELRAELRSGVFDLLPMAGASDWQDFRMLFRSGRGGRTKYVNILARRRADGYDFLIADFRTTFSLAPDLVVVEKSSSKMWGFSGSSETVIRRVPASVTEADVEALMTFFDMAAFQRFAELLEVSPRRRQRRAAAVGTLAAVNAGVDTYSKIAQAFKTKKTSRIVGKIVGKGFNYFAMRSRAHIISGLRPQHLDWYLARVHRLYGLPDTPEVADVIELVRRAGFQEWNKNDFLFEVGSGGRNAWVTVLANRNPDNSYNFLIANVEQKFKLAPDVLIIKKSKSVAGGIYESEKYEFKRMPRSITEADLQMLMNFFNIVTFKRFGSRFRVDTSKLDG